MALRCCSAHVSIPWLPCLQIPERRSPASGGGWAGAAAAVDEASMERSKSAEAEGLSLPQSKRKRGCEVVATAVLPPLNAVALKGAPSEDRQPLLPRSSCSASSSSASTQEQKSASHLRIALERIEFNRCSGSSAREHPSSKAKFFICT